MFSYPGWHTDKELVEETLTRNYLPNQAKKDAQDILKGMYRKQDMFEGKCHHEGIQRLQQQKFTYGGYEKDKQEAFSLFFRCRDSLANDVVEGMIMKEKIYKGERDNEVLKQLDGLELNYIGWNEDKAEVERTLSRGYLRKNAREDALNMIKGLRRKQDLYDDKCTHSGILKLINSKFTYEGWNKDREETLMLFFQGKDKTGEDSLRAMGQKEKIHGGDRTDDILIQLDRLHFSYHNHDEDKKEVERTLSRSYLRNHSRSDAMKMIEGMKRKQAIHDGSCVHAGINDLNSEKYNYPDFEHDKAEAMKLFLSGSDTLGNDVLRSIREKQRIHSGDRSNGILRTLDDAIAAEAEKHQTKQTKVRRRAKATEVQEFQNEALPSNDNLALKRGSVKGIPLDVTLRDDSRSKTVNQKEAPRESILKNVKPKKGSPDATLRGETFPSQNQKTLLPTNIGQRTREDDLKKKTSKSQPHQQTEIDEETIRKKNISLPQRDTPIPETLEPEAQAAESEMRKNFREQNKTQLEKEDPSKRISSTQLPTSDVPTPLTATRLETTRRPVTPRRPLEVKNECVICLERNRQYIFVPCGHLSICENCFQQPPYSGKDGKFECLICRMEGCNLMKIYT
jgi:predicted nuclease with TOPRIM domain